MAQMGPNLPNRPGIIPDPSLSNGKELAQRAVRPKTHGREGRIPVRENSQGTAPQHRPLVEEKIGFFADPLAIVRHNASTRALAAIKTAAFLQTAGLILQFVLSSIMSSRVRAMTADQSGMAWWSALSRRARPPSSPPSQTIVLAIKPSANAERFLGNVGDELIVSTRQLFLDAARALLERGNPPNSTAANLSAALNTAKLQLPELCISFCRSRSSQGQFHNSGRWGTRPIFGRC